jgi:hypothetical protein
MPQRGRLERNALRLAGPSLVTGQATLRASAPLAAQEGKHRERDAVFLPRPRALLARPGVVRTRRDRRVRVARHNATRTFATTAAIAAVTSSSEPPARAAASPASRIALRSQIETTEPSAAFGYSALIRASRAAFAALGESFFGAFGFEVVRCAFARSRGFLRCFLATDSEAENCPSFSRGAGVQSTIFFAAKTSWQGPHQSSGADIHETASARVAWLTR